MWTTQLGNEKPIDQRFERVYWTRYSRIDLIRDLFSHLTIDRPGNFNSGRFMWVGGLKHGMKMEGEGERKRTNSNWFSGFV